MPIYQLDTEIEDISFLEWVPLDKINSYVQSPDLPLDIPVCLEISEVRFLLKPLSGYRTKVKQGYRACLIVMDCTYKKPSAAIPGVLACKAEVSKSQSTRPCLYLVKS